MAKYLFVYHGGSAPTKPEEVQQVMAAWGQWFGSMGGAVIDGGNPVGKSTTVQPDGSIRNDGGPNPASGYSIIDATSLADAQSKARRCPILQSGGSIEVAPITEM